MDTTNRILGGDVRHRARLASTGTAGMNIGRMINISDLGDGAAQKRALRARAYLPCACGSGKKFKWCCGQRKA